jgi:REP element-mobilizing transposase RayT
MPDDLRFKNRYRISSTRLASWDYRWAGVYSVTICTQGRACWFGEIVAGEVVLSPEGRVVAGEWGKIPHAYPHVLLDEWIIMPDHLHGILTFQSRPLEKPTPENAGRLTAGSLGAVINRFKSKATKRIRVELKRPLFAWQARFHDSILREPEDLERLRAYIRANPSRWQ